MMLTCMLPTAHFAYFIALLDAEVEPIGEAGRERIDSPFMIFYSFRFSAVAKHLVRFCSTWNTANLMGHVAHSTTESWWGFPCNKRKIVLSSF